MAQLVVGRDLPNLKICVDNVASNEKLQAVEMEVEDKNENSESEDTQKSESNTTVQVNLNWKSVGVPPHHPKRYENKYAFFVSELKMTAEELQQKLEERAERFGQQLKPKRQVSQDEINAVYKSINLDVENLKTSSEELHIRLEALHVHGVNEMSTNDIFDYFKDYTPAWIEWVNDVSCNVVWLEQLGAVMALLKISRPISLKKSNEGFQEGKADVDDAIVFSEDELTELGLRDGELPAASKSDVAMEDTKTDVENQSKEQVSISMPPGHWRLGMSHPKAKTLLLRFATADDKKIPGAEKHSDYYKKYGNPNYGGMKGLISTTRKRRIRYLKEQDELKKLLGQKNDPLDVSNVEDDLPKTDLTADDDIKERTEAVKRPRMRMHADDEENDPRKKNGVHDRLGKRAESASVSDTTDSESDDLEDSNVVEPEIYRQSSVWDRLEGLSPIRPAYGRTGDRHDLRRQIHNVSHTTNSSRSSDDLRSKLRRLRQEEEPEHRSPMLTKPYEAGK